MVDVAAIDVVAVVAVCGELAESGADVAVDVALVDVALGVAVDDDVSVVDGAAGAALVVDDDSDEVASTVSELVRGLLLAL